MAATIGLHALHVRILASGDHTRKPMRIGREPELRRRRDDERRRELRRRPRDERRRLMISSFLFSSSREADRGAVRRMTRL